MAEPCIATSSRSEGTPDGQLPAQANHAEQPAAAGVAEAAVAPADAAVLPPTDRQQQHTGEAQPAPESGIPEELRPATRTRRQAAKRGRQADFVRGDESDSEAERSVAGGRAGSSNSWHPGDADSDSDASTRKRRKNEQVSLRHLNCNRVSVQTPVSRLQPLVQLLVALRKLTQ